MAYFLPPLVGFCFVGESAVFLDARSDRYWMLPAVTGRSLRQECGGEPLSPEETTQLGELVRVGLLDVSGNHPVVPCRLPAPRTSCLDAAENIPRLSTMIAWLGYAAAARRLRRHGLQSEIVRLERLRRQRSGKPRNVDCSAEAFVWLRLLVSPLGRCLPLSMALAERCACPEVHLVFGVKLSPFAAHAWVQRDTEVLNDELHVVQDFTPVLVV